MNFSKKIYYNDKPLILTTDMEAYIGSHPLAEAYTPFSAATARSFSLALQQIDKLGTKGAIIEDVSSEALEEQLHAMYRPIDAAGGVVFNEDGAILMIYRRGKWDLPKGKLDDGEEIDVCAIREVQEETGLQQVSLDEKICDTYHIYSQHGENLLKRTAWYKMKGAGAEKLKPQKEENILEARWVLEKDMGPLLNKTYEAIKEVLRKAGLKL